MIDALPTETASKSEQYPATMTGKQEQNKTRDTNRFAESRVLYHTEEYSEYIERLERYHRGGYHPLSINDHLNGRYEIVHKLGHGSFSTVWLARDHRTASNVALKILTADNDRPNEVEVLSLLHGATDAPSSRCCGKQHLMPPIIDEFDVEGPNGRHHCLVTAPASRSVHDARDDSQGGVLKLEVSRVIIAQVVKAVAFMHGKGVVHGDLHLGNVLLRLPPSLGGLLPDDFYEKVDRPYLLKVTRADGQDLTNNVPSHAVERVVIGDKYEDIELAEAMVMLSDFGESFRSTETTRLESRVPLFSRAPEHLLSEPAAVTISSDIWSLACMMFTLMGQRHMFLVCFAAEDDMLMEQMDTFGSMPPDMFRKWAKRHDYFTEDQRPVERELAESFAERVEISITKPRTRFANGQLEPEELEAFTSLLRSMLAWKAEDRLSAQGVLESEWMRKWALPDYERAKELWDKEEKATSITSLAGSDSDHRADEAAPEFEGFEMAAGAAEEVTSSSKGDGASEESTEERLLEAGEGVVSEHERRVPDDGVEKSEEVLGGGECEDAQEGRSLGDVAKGIACLLS